MWVEIVKKYLNKNLFYVSVIITGLTSFFIGIFYSLFKDSIFEVTANEFLEGTGVLGAYITESTGRPSETNYFMIALLVSVMFFFIIAFVLSKFLNKKYFYMFNLVSILNVILLFGLFLASIFVGMSLIFTYIFLIVIFIIYLFALYSVLDKILKLDLRKKIISLIIFVIPFIIILIIFKLFV